MAAEVVEDDEAWLYGGAFALLVTAVFIAAFDSSRLSLIMLICNALLWS